MIRTAVFVVGLAASAAWAQPKSLCSDAATKDTLVRLAQRRVDDFAGHPSVPYPITGTIYRREYARLRYEVGSIRNLGIIEGNGGSRCAAVVTVTADGSGDPGMRQMGLNASYSVELTEDKQQMVSARFTLND